MEEEHEQIALAEVAANGVGVPPGKVSQLPFGQHGAEQLVGIGADVYAASGGSARIGLPDDPFMPVHVGIVFPG